MSDFDFDVKPCPHCGSANTKLLGIDLHIDCMRPYVGKHHACNFCKCQFEEQFDLRFDKFVITKEPISPSLREEECFSSLTVKENIYAFLNAAVEKSMGECAIMEDMYKTYISQLPYLKPKNFKYCTRPEFFTAVREYMSVKYGKASTLTKGNQECFTGLRLNKDCWDFERKN